MGNSGANTARTLRIVVALVAIGCFTLGAALTGAYLVIRHVVTNTAIAYAKALGVAIEPSEVRFGLTFIQLIDCRFTALLVPGVSGTVRRVDVDLIGTRPTRVLVSGIELVAEGEPLQLWDASLAYWERLRRQTDAAGKLALPAVEWRHLNARVTTGNPLFPAAAVTELSVGFNVGPTHDETSIRTESTRVGAFDLGPIGLAFRNQDGVFEVGWGKTLVESSWRVAYQAKAGADYVRLSFQPLSVAELMQKVGQSAPPELAKAKVAGYIQGSRERSSGKTAGAVNLTLNDFSPPFPPELKGYRFSDTTTLRADFVVDPLWFAADLRGIELRNGDVSLTGHGRLERELLSVRLRADLATFLDCVTLARGYATDTLGGELGQWGVRNAPKAIRGGVTVRVQIDADSSHLEQAKIIRQLGVGCGLKPMSLVDLLNLGLPPLPDPKTVERLIQHIPNAATALSTLPNLPNLLPSFNELRDAAVPKRPAASQKKNPAKAPSPAAKPSAKSAAPPAPSRPTAP
ncbi:MAG TPA: hypothetical protein VIV60_14590 [Polyangiaceae bacterium]